MGNLQAGRIVPALFHVIHGDERGRRLENNQGCSRRKEQDGPGRRYHGEVVERPGSGVVVIGIGEPRSATAGELRRRSIEMRMNERRMIVVVGAIGGMNVLERRQKKSQRQCQTGLKRNDATHSPSVYSICPTPGEADIERMVCARMVLTRPVGSDMLAAKLIDR
jgi:hypothetical protein